MESPFDHSCSFVIYEEPFYNTYWKTYQNILTVSNMPPGVFASVISPISMQKLSPFQELSTLASPYPTCALAIMRYTNMQGTPTKFANAFMTSEELPKVIGYLQMNGYIVDTSMTKMLQRTGANVGGVSTQRYSGNRKMVCLVSYIP